MVAQGIRQAPTVSASCVPVLDIAAKGQSIGMSLIHKNLKVSDQDEANRKRETPRRIAIRGMAMSLSADG